MRLPQDRILHIDTELAGDEVRVVAEWQGELVRCKDCRHRCKEPIYSEADVHWVIYQIGDCPIIGKTVSDDDYCSHGERREK